MEKEIRGKTLAYWESNAKENYIKTPISVLKYITILEEELKVKNNDVKSNVKSTSICECCKIKEATLCPECVADAIELVI